MATSVAQRVAWTGRGARPSSVAAGCVLVAALVGALIAKSVPLGLAALLGLFYLPLVFISLPLALAGWLVIAFLARLPHLSGPPNLALLLIIFASIGIGAKRRELTKRARPELLVMALGGLFAVWVLLSLAWAQDPHIAKHTVEDYILGALVIVVLIATVREPRHVRWLLAAYILGAVLAVLVGLVDPSIGGTINQDGRLAGGAGDPNYLAALIVPAIMLAGGLAIRASFAERVALAGALAVLGIGLAATQSRGGLLAMGASGLVALLTWRGRRLAISTVLLVLVVAAGAWFASSPTAWNRIAHPDANGSSGRTSIWKVAWHMAEDHPIVGVGIDQFPLESPTYTRRIGTLDAVNLIIGQQIVVHNSYLQTWTETGIVGLLLYLGLIGTSLTCTRRAIHRFAELGDRELEGIARAVLVAFVGWLAASFFLSNANDRRFFVLAALGPALLAMAERRLAARRAELPA